MISETINVNNSINNLIIPFILNAGILFVRKLIEQKKISRYKRKIYKSRYCEGEDKN